MNRNNAAPDIRQNNRNRKPRVIALTGTNGYKAVRRSGTKALVIPFFPTRQPDTGKCVPFYPAYSR